MLDEIFLILFGLVGVVFNKQLARHFSEQQKFLGWKKGTYEFGRYMFVIFGLIFLLVGLVLLLASARS